MHRRVGVRSGYVNQYSGGTSKKMGLFKGRPAYRPSRVEADEAVVKHVRGVLLGIAVGKGYDVKGPDSDMLWRDDIEEVAHVLEACGVRFPKGSPELEAPKSTRPGYKCSHARCELCDRCSCTPVTRSLERAYPNGKVIVARRTGEKRLCQGCRRAAWKDKKAKQTSSD
jgi:hypothetical protein